ncbi:nucleoside diphosphate kinase regulator [Chromatiaceae bacterium AAb-1]|nr:nucleoside diphosphate kinase regulator [Chromatiaceae bacterium AAb-1]
MLVQPAITVSTLDMDRIEALIDKMPKLSPEVEQLVEELDRAAIVEPENMPDNVVTMNSTVRFAMAGNNKVFEKVLCYPKDAAASEQHLSVFTPVGSALLGLSVGQKISWPMANNTEVEVEIVDVVYQPERAGDYRL